MASLEDLKAENARLLNEMSTMKKKIMVAMKKQQAELQGKVQAAEKSREEAELRAAAVEALAANQHTELTTELKQQVEELKSELIATVKAKSEAEERASSGDNRMQQAEKALLEARKALELEIKGRKALEAECEKFVELRKSHDGMTTNVLELEKVREGLEQQLLSAATQVSDAVARAAVAEEERQKQQQRMVTFAQETEVKLQELERCQSRLAEFEKKNREVEETYRQSAVAAKSAEAKCSKLSESLRVTLAELEAVQAESQQQRAAMAEAKVLRKEVEMLKRSLQAAEAEKKSLQIQLEDVAAQQAEEQAEAEAEAAAAGSGGSSHGSRELEMAEKRVKEAEEAVAAQEERASAAEEECRVVREAMERLQSVLVETQSEAGRVGKLEESLAAMERETLAARNRAEEMAVQAKAEWEGKWQKLEEESRYLRRQMEEALREKEVALAQLNRISSGVGEEAEYDNEEEAERGKVLAELEMRCKQLESDLESALKRADEAEAKAEAQAQLQVQARETEEEDVKGSEAEVAVLQAEVQRLQAEVEVWRKEEESRREEMQALVQDREAALGRLAESEAAWEAKAQAWEEERAGHAADIRVREDKYAEMDSTLKRLQKRAKQRIQEVTKEKDELESQLVAESGRAAAALSALASAQEELGRVCSESSASLRAAQAEAEAVAAEREALRQEVEELQRSLEGKEMALAESRRLAAAQEQAMLEMSSVAQEEHDRMAASLAEARDKWHKERVELERRVAEAEAEEDALTQALMAAKRDVHDVERQLAEVEARLSGEVARLTASLESVKGELAQAERQREEEGAELQAAVDRATARLAAQQAESAARAEQAERAQAELAEQVAAVKRELAEREAEVAGVRAEVERVSGQLGEYRVRAGALLQRKKEELESAMDKDKVAAQAERLKVAESTAAEAVSEAERLRRVLQEAVREHEHAMAAQCGLLLESEQRVRELMLRQDSSRAFMAAQQHEWQQRMEEAAAQWQAKLDAVQGAVNTSMEAQLRQELEHVKAEHTKLQSESVAWRSMADKMLEEKDSEIQRLLAQLQAGKSAAAAAAAAGGGGGGGRGSSTPSTPTTTTTTTSPAHNASTYAAENGGEKVEPSSKASMLLPPEQQILILARQQAQREEEVEQCRRHIQALQDEISELERENRLHAQQEALLKEEMRNMDRAQTRETVDMTYLKNVVLKMLQTGEVVAVLPVVAMLLQFSPDEVKKCQEAYQNSQRDSLGNSDKPLTLFQIFSFGGSK